MLATSFKTAMFTVSPLIRLTLRPSISLRLRVMVSPSGKISIASSLFLSLSSSTENVSSTSPLPVPFLSISALYLAPSASPTDPRRMDFPAPVSPVRILSPGPKSTSVSSMSARFFTCRFCNIPLSIPLLKQSCVSCPSLSRYLPLCGSRT